MSPLFKRKEQNMDMRWQQHRTNFIWVAMREFFHNRTPPEARWDTTPRNRTNKIQVGGKEEKWRFTWIAAKRGLSKSESSEGHGVIYYHRICTI
jgi:hypothetical protein